MYSPGRHIVQSEAFCSDCTNPAGHFLQNVVLPNSDMYIPMGHPTQSVVRPLELLHFPLTHSLHAEKWFAATRLLHEPGEQIEHAAFSLVKPGDVP